jgi:hypothetical protein
VPGRLASTLRRTIAATRRSLYGIGAKHEIEPHVARTAKMQLAMVITMVADRVSLDGDAPRDIGPPLDVTSEQKERRANVCIAQDIEDARRRFSVRPVIERERDLSWNCRSLAALGMTPNGQTTQDAAEDRTVAMKGAV